MQIKINKEKCVNCGECLRACPEMKDNFSSNILNCNNCGDCAKACPEKAIYKVEGIYKIDKEKCNNCGICIEVCDRKALIPQNDFPAKCDQCIETGNPKCISICPYNSIAIEYCEKEKEVIEKITGWRKTKKNHDKIVAIYEDHEIQKDNDERFYVTYLKEVTYDEAILLEKVLNAFRKEEKADEAIAEEIIEQYCSFNKIKISEKQKQRLVELINQESFGFSILDNLLKDNDLEEIAVIGKEKPIFVYHKIFGWLETDLVFINDEKIKNIINKIGRNLGRRVSLQNPRMNADVGFARVHAAIPPASDDSCITIRKFNSKPFTTKELAKETISEEALGFLKMCLNSDVNLLICGNTGSGKTSTLNTLFSFLPEKDRVVVIEETPELYIEQKHQVRLIANENTPMSDLVADSLRMRPDRIIVGEVRTPNELKALINTMLAGQGKSSFATFHAQNSEEALIRMASLGINEVDLNALDLIVVQRRWTDANNNKTIRKITEISYVKKTYSGKPEIEKIFEFNPKTKKLVRNKKAGKQLEQRISYSYGFDESDFNKKLNEVKAEI